MKAAKFLFPLILAALALPFPLHGEEAGGGGDVAVTQRREGDTIQIFAENTSAKSQSITLELTNILHAKSDGWPVKVTKRFFPGDRVMMTALIQNTGEAAATFTCTVTTSDKPVPSPVQLKPAPRQTITIPIERVRTPTQPAKPVEAQPPLQPVDPNFAYHLPFEPGTPHMVSQGYGGVVSHKGTYALDFEMPLDSSVCAARDGVVIELEKKRAPTDNDATIGNFVAIKHADGTVALYAQLAQEGVLVTVGQQVRAGDIIAKSGTTGHSNGPHLHFEVDSMKDCIGVTTKGERGSIPVIFVTRQGNNVSLHVGNSYSAE